MSPVAQVLLTSSLTFGVPLVLAIRELWMLRRPNPRPWRPDPPNPLPIPPGGLPALRRLPDCLIPKLPPHAPAGRVRILERA